MELYADTAKSNKFSSVYDEISLSSTLMRSATQ